MESPKYLIIITLIEGQNFTVPDGIHDKIEATVFAEARFGNESILKSDPIKLINSNPEFVTELAWQLDKRSLHQLRVERRAIKLQIFMQTRSRKKSNQIIEHTMSNGFQSNDSSPTNKVELIGYTVIDIRSAQEREPPKFQWLPLLNPKFRKSSYNRPEVQLAITLSRIDENPSNVDSNPHPSTSTESNSNSLKSKKTDRIETPSKLFESDIDGVDDSNKLYRTCLDFTLNSDTVENDEVIENDIQIRSKNGYFFIYDTRNPRKSTMDDCDEKYRITVTIPFNSELDTLITKPKESYYFSVNLLGACLRTNQFNELTSVETKEVQFLVYTTNSSVLVTYFELNSSLIIKLHESSGEPLGITTIQLDQLSSLDTKCRSIEGIFALQSMLDVDIPLSIHPSIGVSVVLERIQDEVKQPMNLVSDDHIEMAKRHFGDDVDEYLQKTWNDTHQLTLEGSNLDINSPETTSIVDIDSQKQNDHHFCFTIDLKNFSYTPNQRLIPTLRELVVRYSYPFFGYKDTITTDASIPISPTKAIIISGFCEFNFATTLDSLLTALKEIPLNLEILTCDQTKRSEIDVDAEERIVATCNLNLAEVMCLSKSNIDSLEKQAITATASVPILGLNGGEIGEIQIFLCLKDLGKPSYNLKSSIETIDKCATDGHQHQRQQKDNKDDDKQAAVSSCTQRFDTFIQEAKSNFETWKEEYFNKLSDEVRRRENERFKKIYQRLEAKEAKREQEFRKKMEDLISLEKRFKNSFSYIESLEKRLSNNLDQLKTKDALLDTRLDTLDLKISKAMNDIKLEYEKRLGSLPGKSVSYNYDANQKTEPRSMTKIPTKPTVETFQARRSSLRNASNTASIPVPVRSSSLVRGTTEGSTTRFVKRPTNIVTTVVNGITSRQRSNSTRFNLTKETQEKLANLRKEKAELLKRGCRPNDELIQEINAMIEKIVY